MNKKVITFGEVMLRLATPEHQRFAQTESVEATYGGGEVNVSASLASFGIPTSFVTRLPNNDIGRSCNHRLNGLGVDTSSVVWGGDRLGIYFLETGAVARGSKVVYDRSSSAFTQFKKGMVNWDLVFDNATWFHWTGIIPAISKGATHVLEEALENAEMRGITVSCDVNYRSKLWKANNKASSVMPDLIAKTDILIANEFDADKVLCVNTGLLEDCKYSNATFKQISEKLMEKYPRIKKVITSRRGTINANYNKLVGIIYDGQKVWESPTFEITHIVDRVGGGDALMAGLIYGFLSFPNDSQRIIDFAVAASFIKHTVSGDVNLLSVSEVEKVMRGDIGGKIDW